MTKNATCDLCDKEFSLSVEGEVVPDGHGWLVVCGSCKKAKFKKGMAK